MAARVEAGPGAPEPRETLIALFRCAVAAVSAKRVMPKSMPVLPTGRLVAIAAGKAAADMMRVAQARSPVPLPGLVVTRYGHVPEDFAPGPGVALIEAGHPAPDENSLRGGARALEIASGLNAQDHLLIMLSGGGSALLAAPAPGVSLGDKQAITRALLRSGAAIEEMNVVRKHLSRIKGGRLAAAAGPARVTSWLISDVPGDDPALIASGPSVADRSTLAEARTILTRYNIQAPPSVLAALRDPANESPPADTPGLAGAEIAILARGQDALAAAEARAADLGLQVENLGDALVGEARELGFRHARLALELSGAGGGRLILSGGETSVTIFDSLGRGGRNLEYLLALAIALDGVQGVHAIACDTDGIDGTESAAGATISPDTLSRAKACGIDAEACLARNDAYTFFEAIGDLVVTGPTFTNVNDFRAILIA